MADEPPPMDFEETPPPEDDVEQEKDENPFGASSEVEEKETANEPPSKQEGIDSLIVCKNGRDHFNCSSIFLFLFYLNT